LLIRNISKQQSRTQYFRLFLIAGRTVLFEASDPWIFNALVKLNSALFVTDITEAKPASVDCTLRFFVGKSGPARIDGPRFELPDGTCWTDGGDFYLGFDGSWVTVKAGAPRVINVWISEQLVRYEDDLRLKTAFGHALQLALRRCGLYLFHAAAVVEPKSNTNVLIIGKSGSGKSTLCLRLASSGWKYLTDDAVLLSAHSGGIGAWAFRRMFAVTDSVIDACGGSRFQQALGPTLRHDPTKRKLRPRDAFPDSFVDFCLPAVLCFPVLVGEKTSRVAPLTKKETMQRLIVQNPWSTYDTIAAREYFHSLSTLARQAAGYVLYSGTDLLEEPERAASFFESELRPRV
jgi:hypothetical protein